jgi:acyl-CoA dehydrogenase
MDFVIGGQDNIGRGWQMLVSCLGAGRGISLPVALRYSHIIQIHGPPYPSEVPNQISLAHVGFHNVARSEQKGNINQSGEKLDFGIPR